MSKKIISNTLYYSIGEIIPRLLSFILLPIYTVYLTTTEYGMNSYITSVMGFVFLFSSLSLNTFFLRNYFTQKSKKERLELTGSIFLFILYFNFILVGLQIIFFPLIISYFEINVPYYPFFVLAIFINFFESTSIVPLNLYRVKEDAKGFLKLNLSKTIMQFVFVYVFVVSLEGGLEGSLIARLLINIPYFFIYFLITKNNSILRINFKYIRQGLRFSLPLLPGAISFLLITLSDRIIMERYISLNQLGIFSVAATLSFVLNIVIQSLYKSFEPIIFKEFLNDNFQSTNTNLFRIYLFFLFVGGFGISIFSKELFQLFTSEAFLSGYRAVPLLIVSVIFSGINTYYSILLIASKKTIIISSVFMLTAIINVMMNFILIPLFGYYGAIYASIISFFITNLIFQHNIFIHNKYLFCQFILIILVISIPNIFDLCVNTSIVMSIASKIILCLIFIVISFLLLEINIGSVKNYFRINK